MGGGAKVANAGRSLCLAGAALGALALVGWITDAYVLTTFVAGRPPMVPNTGAALILCGVGAALRSREPTRPVPKALAALCGALVLALGVVTMAEYALKTSFGVDQLLIPITGVDPHPGRPSPPVALAFVLLGSALLLFDARRTARVRPVEALALGTAFIALVTLVGHTLGAGRLYQLEGEPVIGVALPTAIALLLICSGILLERPDAGFMHLATSAGPGGMLFRRLSLVALVIAPLVGILVSRTFAWLGVRDLPLTLAVVTTSMLPVALILLAITAVHVDRAHDALHRSREQLRELFERSADGIFVADVDGRYTEVNRIGCQILGYSRDEILGKTIVDLIPPDEVQRLSTTREKLLEGAAEVSEWHLRRKNGDYVPVEVAATILPDGRWQGLVRDITARKAAEEALRLSEAKLQGIISIAADAIVSVDEDQRIVIYNEGAVEAFGWSRAEALGKPLDILIPERFREIHRAHIHRFAADPASARRVTGPGRCIFGLRKDGQVFPAEAAISKLAVGGHVLFTVILRDISATRRLEEELGRSRESFRLLAENARDLIYRYRLTPPRGFEYVSPASTQMTGFTPQDHYADPDLRRKLVYEEDRPLLEAVTRGESCERPLALRWVKKDGTVFWTEQRNVPIYGPGGELVAIEGIARDITDRKRIENEQRFLARVGGVLGPSLDLEEILGSSAELAVAFVADCCIVVLVDDRGRVAMRQMVPVDAERPHFTSTTLTKREPTLVPDVTEDFLRSVAESDHDLEILRGLSPRSLMAAPIVVRDRLLGAIILLSSRKGVRFGPSDLELAIELARRTGLAIENATLYEAAQKAIRARDEVLSVVAHDLRNPLGVAQLAAARLVRKGPEGERRASASQSAEMIQRSLRRANGLIGDLLDITRIEGGRLAVEARQARPEELVHEAAEMFAAADTPIAVETQIDAGLPSVLADGQRIHQVFSNLVGNAIKFTPAGGRACIAADRYEGQVRFAVTNSGEGIAPEHLPHVFDRFWQARPTDRRGAGLGLAIAKGIVEAHGGRIWAESEAGVATTFYFTLPVAPPLEDRPTDGAPAHT